jgi:MoaA/NifB/PqqE/SkfB family radical SAM enzyme
MLLGAEIGDLHIELTSRCTLACPRCQRTADPDQLQVGDLPLSIVKKTLTRANFPALRYINFCGNYGDPIYHRQFHRVIAHVRREGFRIRIETNGSYRPAAWWARTAKILSRGDQVQFSIDGLEDTNHLYRVNARWSDILIAIEALRGRVYLVWKLIVFRHNQHQIETARERAQSLGFDEFRLIRSSRFDGRWRDASGIDPLKPDPQWVGGRKAISEQIAILRHG